MLRLHIWLRNTIRNRLRPSLIGRAMGMGASTLKRVRVVSATRSDESAFWSDTALGRSLATWRQDPRIELDLSFTNRAGLPTVYNAALARARDDEGVLFIHDDVWLDDPQWIDKLLLALKRYDVVGLAGSRTRRKGQPSWVFHWGAPDKLVAHGGTSGMVGHGPNPRGEMSVFGPTPALCELLDGLFIAVDIRFARASGVQFDERFAFHFYDMDFCRTARSAGLSLGTWPIVVTHQSTGAFLSPTWREGLAGYLAKWKG